MADDSRLLAPDSSRGYVNHPARAMSAEPKAVSEEAQRRLSDEARRRWEVVKGEELARKARARAIGRIQTGRRSPMMMSEDAKFALGY